MARQRLPVLHGRGKRRRRGGEDELIDPKQPADGLPEQEQAEGEQPGGGPFQRRGVHALRTSAILVRNSCTILVNAASSHRSRSRGRGRSTSLVTTMCPGRALMTWIWSARKIASRRSCVTRMTVQWNS